VLIDKEKDRTNCLIFTSLHQQLSSYYWRLSATFILLLEAFSNFHLIIGSFQQLSSYYWRLSATFILLLEAFSNFHLIIGGFQQQQNQGLGLIKSLHMAFPLLADFAKYFYFHLYSNLLIM